MVSSFFAYKSRSYHCGFFANSRNFFGMGTPLLVARFPFPVRGYMQQSSHQRDTLANLCFEVFWIGLAHKRPLSFICVLKKSVAYPSLPHLIIASYPRHN